MLHICAADELRAFVSCCRSASRLLFSVVDLLCACILCASVLHICAADVLRAFVSCCRPASRLIFSAVDLLCACILRCHLADAPLCYKLFVIVLRRCTLLHSRDCATVCAAASFALWIRYGAVLLYCHLPRYCTSTLRCAAVLALSIYFVPTFGAVDLCTSLLVINNTLLIHYSSFTLTSRRAAFLKFGLPTYGSAECRGVTHCTSTSCCAAALRSDLRALSTRWAALLHLTLC